MCKMQRHGACVPARANCCTGTRATVTARGRKPASPIVVVHNVWQGLSPVQKCRLTPPALLVVSRRAVFVAAPLRLFVTSLEILNLRPGLSPESAAPRMGGLRARTVYRRRVAPRAVATALRSFARVRMSPEGGGGLQRLAYCRATCTLSLLLSW